MTLKEQIDGLTAQLSAKDADIAAMKAAHEAAIVALKAECEGKYASAAALVKALSADVDTAKAATIAVEAERDGIKKQLAEQTARAESAEQKLSSNPAFEHASAKGVKPVSEVNTESGIETDEQFLAKYNAEKDPAKRTLMYQARMKLLQKS
jgi:hypothetical protein